MSESPHFFDLNPEELTAWSANHGWPAYRARQLAEWVYKKFQADPGRMTSFSKLDREKIALDLRLSTLGTLGHQQATDDTEKLLLEVPASEGTRPGAIECVSIPAVNDLGRRRRTACVSSQVGCPVGCKFCASGLGGLDRHLTAGQIVEQIWHLNRLESASRLGPVTHVVFMGMGEPLSNFSQVLKAVRTLTADWGFGLSARRITISTVGVPAQIRRLAEQIDLPVTLAISLHAPNDALRRTLIPWAESTTISAITDAASFYFEKTGREITLEYILLGGVNDKPEHATELAGLAKKLRCSINLIRYNEVKGLPFNRPHSEDVLAFQTRLLKAGIRTRIRASRGRDIAAACGQLRHESQKTG